MQKMYVSKRDGTLEPLSLDKILKRIQQKCKGLSDNLDPNKIAIETISYVIDGISTRKLDELASKVAATYMLEEPDYTILASRLSISSMHKDVALDFTKVTEKLYSNGLLNGTYYKKALKYSDLVNSLYEKYHKLDYDFDYFGWKTLEKSYLLKKPVEKNDEYIELYERPIHMYTRVALTVTDSEYDFEQYFIQLITDL